LHARGEGPFTKDLVSGKKQARLGAIVHKGRFEKKAVRSSWGPPWVCVFHGRVLRLVPQNSSAELKRYLAREKRCRVGGTAARSGNPGEPQESGGPAKRLIPGTPSERFPGRPTGRIPTVDGEDFRPKLPSSCFRDTKEVVRTA